MAATTYETEVICLYLIVLQVQDKPQGWFGSCVYIGAFGELCVYSVQHGQLYYLSTVVFIFQKESEVVGKDSCGPWNCCESDHLT